MFALFLDSFFASFALTFQGEMALTAMSVFYDDMTIPYIVAVCAGVCGLLLNYCIGRGLAYKLVPILDQRSHDKYTKTHHIMNKYIIFLLPIASLGFIGNVVFLEGVMGHLINVMGNTLIQIFAVAVTFFAGLFKMKFIPFLLVLIISRFISYYFYVF